VKRLQSHPASEDRWPVRGVFDCRGHGKTSRQHTNPISSHSSVKS
jgi:hypothetical protein